MAQANPSWRAIEWHSKTPAAEEPIQDAQTVVGMGYGESKWVAERVLDRAAKTTALRPVIVRIGQLSGGKNGSWNTTEWIPAVVRSGEVVKALPASDEVRAKQTDQQGDMSNPDVSFD